MDIAKIKQGMRVNYVSRANAGRGTVLHVYEGGRGHYVTVCDKERGKTVTVRPSQVSK